MICWKSLKAASDSDGINDADERTGASRYTFARCLAVVATRTRLVDIVGGNYPAVDCIAPPVAMVAASIDEEIIKKRFQTNHYRL